MYNSMHQIPASLMPEHNLGMVVLTNLSGSFLPTVLASRLYDLVLGLDPIDWTARFEQDSQANSDATRAHNEQVEAVRKTGTNPSNSLEDYTGQYLNPGYGVLVVELTEGALSERYD